MLDSGARGGHGPAMRKSDSALLFDLDAGPDFSMEIRAGARRAPVAGVDEAGRGPWAGPVVTAAVVLDEAKIPRGLDDSKALTEARREALYDLICADHLVAVTFASVDRIDRMNIRGATLWAMSRAVRALGVVPVHVLVDGKDVPPGLPCPGEAVVKGDTRALSIAAASIVAKVTRDRMMVRLAREFDGYGFDRHKGYGTAEHQQALDRLGPCVLHRRSFEPIRTKLGGAMPAPEARPALL